MRSNPSTILQELESDDELPDDYEDIPIFPDYLDDNRFDDIQFPWINVNLDKTVTSQTKTCLKQDHPMKIISNKGVLKGQDLYCLKSVQSLTCSNTFIWFVNFLLLKDLQSDFNYLRSCLVSDFISTVPFGKTTYAPNNQTVLENRFEIVIKSN